MFEAAIVKKVVFPRSARKNTSSNQESSDILVEAKVFFRYNIFADRNSSCCQIKENLWNVRNLKNSI